MVSMNEGLTGRLLHRWHCADSQALPLRKCSCPICHLTTLHFHRSLPCCSAGLQQTCVCHLYRIDRPARAWCSCCWLLQDPFSWSLATCAVRFGIHTGRCGEVVQLCREALAFRDEPRR